MKKHLLVRDSYSQVILREAWRILQQQKKEHAPLIRKFKRLQRLKRLQNER